MKSFILLLSLLTNVLKTSATDPRSNVNSTDGAPIYIIPVVFHIIHDYGVENVSDSDVKVFLKRLNDNFQKLNADTINIIPQFQSIAADCQIEFRLAHLDPNGNCTNGIEHIPSHLTHNGGVVAQINPWPIGKYVNFWTVENQTAAGFSTPPFYSALNPIHDGLVLNYTMITDSGLYGLATQMMGRYLNLLKTYGPSGNIPGIICGDDSVADTPETMGWDHCPQPAQAAICNAPQIENYQNFMEDSYCLLMFTNGQKARMHACLNSTVASRNNLWTPANLQATGTDSLNYLPCSPIADFEPLYKFICEGDSIQFTDRTWNGPVGTRHWIFTGGIPSTSVDSMPVVLYPVHGDYDVELQITNATGGDTLIRVATVHVLNPPIGFQYSDDFETVGTFPGNGYLINPDSMNTWHRITTVGYSGVSCIKLSNDSNITLAATDEWILPLMDFNSAVTPQLSFRRAFANGAASNSDEFKIFKSSDCGNTWIPVHSYFGPDIATVAGVIPNFVPTSQSQWETDTFSLTGLTNHYNVHIKFQYIGKPSNNLYIDDINIFGGTVGVEELAMNELGLNLVPNPAADKVQLTYTLSEKSEVKVSIMDVTGRIVFSQPAVSSIIGENSTNIDLTKFNPGIYLVKLDAGGKAGIRKLIVY